MFPVIVLTEDAVLPKGGIYYVVAKNGLFLHKENAIVKATVKINSISFLQDLGASVALDLPKLPAALMARSFLFFRRVFGQFGSEGELLLHYSVPRGEYLLWCSRQVVSHVAVSRCDYSERFGDYQLIGTIHSHADFTAFHSSTDRQDEADFDGLHITLGHVNEPYFTLACSVVINGNRFVVPPEDIISGIRAVRWKANLKNAYRRRVMRHEQEEEAEARMDFRRVRLEAARKEGCGEEQFYDLVLGKRKDYRSARFPAGWLQKLNHVL